MENEKSRLPSFLQDRKKTLIIAIVVLAMILSFISSVFWGSVIVNTSLAKKIKPILKQQGISITSLLKSDKHRLNGTYVNDYVDEELHFHLDGSLEYTSGEEIFAMGTYKLTDKTLTLTINGSESEFDIIDKTNVTLVFSNGDNVFSFTKEQ